MTMPTRYVRGPDGQIVAVPEPVVPVEEVEEEEPEGEGDGISDLFETPKREDVSDVFEVSEETEVSPEDVLGEDEPDPELTEEDEDALFGVSEADVMGEAPEPPKPQKPKLRRTIKRFPPPPTTLGGMR